MTARHAEGSHSKRLLLVEKQMPIMSKKAVERFVLTNPHLEGIHWADALDMLSDADANLEVTEPVYETLESLVSAQERPYINLVTLTLHWAQPDRPINAHAVLLRVRAFRR